MSPKIILNSYLLWSCVNVYQFNLHEYNALDVLNIFQPNKHTDRMQRCLVVQITQHIFFLGRLPCLSRTALLIWRTKFRWSYQHKYVLLMKQHNLWGLTNTTLRSLKNNNLKVALQTQICGTIKQNCGPT